MQTRRRKLAAISASRRSGVGAVDSKMFLSPLVRGLEDPSLRGLTSTIRKKRKLKIPKSSLKSSSNDRVLPLTATESFIFDDNAYRAIPTEHRRYIMQYKSSINDSYLHHKKLLEDAISSVEKELLQKLTALYDKSAEDFKSSGNDENNANQANKKKSNNISMPIPDISPIMQAIDTNPSSKDLIDTNFPCHSEEQKKVKTLTKKDAESLKLERDKIEKLRKNVKEQTSKNSKALEPKNSVTLPNTETVIEKPIIPELSPVVSPDVLIEECDTKDLESNKTISIGSTTGTGPDPSSVIKNSNTNIFSHHSTSGILEPSKLYSLLGSAGTSATGSGNSGGGTGVEKLKRALQALKETQYVEVIKEENIETTVKEVPNLLEHFEKRPSNDIGPLPEPEVQSTVAPPKMVMGRLIADHSVLDTFSPIVAPPKKPKQDLLKEVKKNLMKGKDHVDSLQKNPVEIGKDPMKNLNAPITTTIPTQKLEDNIAEEPNLISREVLPPTMPNMMFESPLPVIVDTVNRVSTAVPAKNPAIKSKLVEPTTVLPVWRPVGKTPVKSSAGSALTPPTKTPLKTKQDLGAINSNIPLPSVKKQPTTAVRTMTFGTNKPTAPLQLSNVSKTGQSTLANLHLAVPQSAHPPVGNITITNKRVQQLKLTGNAQNVPPTPIQAGNISLAAIQTDDEDDSSEDEMSYNKKMAIKRPNWVLSPNLKSSLINQESINPDLVFTGLSEKLQVPILLDDIFKKSMTNTTSTSTTSTAIKKIPNGNTVQSNTVVSATIRARSSSAAWSGTDKLTSKEIKDYNTQMGYH